jgi:hypothetical protein
MNYTVIGLWLRQQPVVAGVIEGEHNCVDSSGGDPYSDGRWATSVEAKDPDEAEELAVEEMEANNQ